MVELFKPQMTLAQGSQRDREDWLEIGSVAQSIISHEDPSVEQSSQLPQQVSQTNRSSTAQAPQTLTMDYALKRKLIEKRRELQQRARRAVDRTSNLNSMVASTSILTNNKSFSFNDILKAEKEFQKRTRFLRNKLKETKTFNNVEEGSLAGSTVQSEPQNEVSTKRSDPTVSQVND